MAAQGQRGSAIFGLGHIIAPTLQLNGQDAPLRAAVVHDKHADPTQSDWGQRWFAVMRHCRHCHLKRQSAGVATFPLFCP